MGPGESLSGADAPVPPGQFLPFTFHASDKHHMLRVFSLTTSSGVHFWALLLGGPMEQNSI